MIPVAHVLDEAWRFAGQRYVFGAEIRPSQDPAVGPVDCSELVEAACRRAGVRPVMPDGAFWQWRHTQPRRITVAEAATIPGALLFIGGGVGTGRDAITHVGFSLGDGRRTLEARGAAWPVGAFPWQPARWDWAALIPGVDHNPRPVIAPALPERPPVATKAQVQTEVEKAYHEVLLRPGDLGGVAYWTQEVFEGRLTIVDLRSVFKGQLDTEQTAALQALAARVDALENRPPGAGTGQLDGVYRITPATPP